MTRTAKPKEWTAFDGLLRQIAEEQFLPIAADDLMAFKLAWELILDRLERNAWEARTVAPESYQFTVIEGETATHTGNAVDLREGNVLESDFWRAFIEASEASGPYPTLKPDRTWAERHPDENSFTFSLVHPGRPTIAGAVRGIEVRICYGELARQKRGRKPNSKNKKSTRKPEIFNALMDEAAERIARGEDQSAVVKWAREEVKARGIGRDHTAQADTQAIRRDLKERGLWTSPA